MAHIVRFKVEGLAGRSEPYVQELNRDVNVFFGVNGGGKTSLLKILHSALSADASIIDKVPFHSAMVTIYSVNQKKELIYKITKNREETSEGIIANNLPKIKFPSNILAEDEVSSISDANLTNSILYATLNTYLNKKRNSLTWKAQDKKETPISLQHRYLPTTRLLYGNPPKELAAFSEDFFDKIFESATEKMWQSLLHKIQGQIRLAQQTGLANILYEVLGGETKKSNHQNVDELVAYERMMNFLARQELTTKSISKSFFLRRLQEEPLVRNVIGRIDRVEREIEQALTPRSKLQELISKLITKNKSIFLQDDHVEIVSSNKEKIGLGSLSSGEKHLLRILLDVQAASENSLIIDEPEISMHIDWQRELIASMRELNPDVQLILATHSPEIMADLDDSKIFRL